MAGAAFDFLDLNQPSGMNYTIARSSTGHLFDMIPVDFPGGATMTGTIRTNGHTGTLTSADILSWNFNVDQITRDIFNSSNSTLLASGLDLTPDGQLGVGNPDGYLAFGKGAASGHPFAVQLADFTDQSPPGGQAGYFQGRFAVTTINLHAPRGLWPVTGTNPISMPEPDSLSLLGAGLAGAAVLSLRRRKSVSRPRA
jgi:hypothetical protein